MATLAEGNKALIRRYIEEAWNRGDLSVIGEVFAESHVGNDPANPGVRGPEGVRQLVILYRSAFPDTHFIIEDQIAEGDRVVTRWRASGTHKGELIGIAPTGKRVTVTGIDVSRISGGKVVESWGNWDTLGLMQQLGVVPSLS
jgi:steroid delta-isomerase-like uncharacterized protein